MKKNTEHLTTGEFAELFGVKKQTLFHYDDMGLLRPEAVGENGYRYYSHNQLEAFSIILMLREMGLSIPEIKAQIDKHSPEDLVLLLKEKNEEIDRVIEHLRWSKEYIERKIATTEEGIALRTDAGGIRTGEIIRQTLPDELMIKTAIRGPGDEKTVNEAIGDHFRYLRSMGLESCYPDGATIPLSSVKRNGSSAEYSYDSFYTILTPIEIERSEDPSGKDTGGAVMDYGGEFIVIYDDRGYSCVGECLLKLIEYADEHGLKIGDHFYEDLIWDDLSVKDYKEYLIKLSVQVI